MLRVGYKNIKSYGLLEVCMFNLKFNHPEYSDKKINESLFDILKSNTLLSLASVTPDSKAHINTLFYAFDDKLKLYVITDPKSDHSKNLKKNASVAIAIFNSQLKFWKDDVKGVQLFGKCYRTPIIQLSKATTRFIKRFPVFKSLVKNPKDFAKKAVAVKIHTIEVDRIKILDEARFGEENYIEAKIK